MNQLLNLSIIKYEHFKTILQSCLHTLSGEQSRAIIIQIIEFSSHQIADLLEKKRRVKITSGLHSTSKTVEMGHNSDRHGGNIFQ